MLPSYMQNFDSQETQQLPLYLNRCNMLNGRKLSFSESMPDIYKRFTTPQHFEMKRENVDRRTRNMPYFHDDDDNRNPLLTYDGCRRLRPQSFHGMPISCTENKMNDQINFYSKRKSHAEPLESSLMTEDNKDLAENSLALIRVPSHDGEISLRQQTPLHSDILHSQKNYPQQSNFSFVPRKPFLNPFLNPHLQRYNFHKYTPNLPPFATGFPHFNDNPFRQNCPPFRMKPCGYNCYAQPTRFPRQEYCRFPAHRMKLSQSPPDYEWDFINDPDVDHYQWNQNDMEPRTHFEFPNYQRRKHQNNFGLRQPIYCHDAISLQEISADPYSSNETDINEIEEAYFAYLQQTIPNFNVVPKKSNLKITSLIPEKKEESLTDQTGNKFGDSHQTARSLMLVRLLKILEDNIDMSNYSMDFQENYVDSHGRRVDPFQTYITDLEHNKLRSQRRDDVFVQETLPSHPPVVILRNRMSDVMTLDEGATVKSSAKYVEKKENNYEKNIKINNTSIRDYFNRTLDVPVGHRQAQQTQQQQQQQQQQREEQENHHILQSHPEVIVGALRKERNVLEGLSEPPSFTAPRVRGTFFKTSVEQPIDMLSQWEKEREFQRYNMFKPEFVPENRIYSNASQIPLSHDIFDGETGKRDVINISQQSLIRKSADPNEIPYETIAEYFQSSAAEINPNVNTKYVFLKDVNSEGIQEDILNKVKCQSKLRSFDEKPFVTEVPDESGPEYEIEHEGELLGRQSFMALKQRFETEKHVQFVDEDNDDSYRKYPYFKRHVDNNDYTN